MARWLGSHGAAVALQATLGASASFALAYLSYELLEKRFLRLKPLFETAKEPPPRQAALSAAKPTAGHCRKTSEGAQPIVSRTRSGPFLPLCNLRPSKCNGKGRRA
jgi:hypothetical protein